MKKKKPRNHPRGFFFFICQNRNLYYVVTVKQMCTRVNIKTILICNNYLMPQITMGRALVASVVAAFLGVTSLIVAPLTDKVGTKIYISPADGLLTVGETFEVTVKVDANIPVNVFSGLITYNNQTLHIEKIDYNTSIADLWAVLPWYSNGDGTMNFAGGTTRPGGFTGSGDLITITFKTLATGEAALMLDDARILQHDGLGTDVELVDNPIDALFTISPEALEEITIVKEESQKSRVRVVTTVPSTDLNHDGKQNFPDMSIFMTYLPKQDLRADFNLDGIVNLADLSILMNR